MSDTTIQEFSSCLFEVADKLSDKEYKNLYELLAKLKNENEGQSTSELKELVKELENQNGMLRQVYSGCKLRYEKLENTNRQLKHENNNFKTFINDMTKKIFTKNINGIGDKMRRKLYDIFNDSSEDIRGYNDTDGYSSYKNYIEVELNEFNSKQWYNKYKGRMYFGDKE